jgi:hypothetical protein
MREGSPLCWWPNSYNVPVEMGFPRFFLDQRRRPVKRSAPLEETGADGANIFAVWRLLIRRSPENRRVS